MKEWLLQKLQQPLSTAQWMGKRKLPKQNFITLTQLYLLAAE